MHGMLRTGIACVAFRGKMVAFETDKEKIHLTKKERDSHCQDL